VSAENRNEISPIVAGPKVWTDNMASQAEKNRRLPLVRRLPAEEKAIGLTDSPRLCSAKPFNAEDAWPSNVPRTILPESRVHYTNRTSRKMGNPC
jgi:hypothetical protein